MADLAGSVLPDDLIAAARERSEALGQPTSKAEAWRYVDTRALERAELDAGGDCDAVARARSALGSLADGALLVVDGQLQDPAAAPDGVELRQEASSEELAAWRQRLASADVAEVWTWADCRGLLAVHLRGALAAPLRIVHVVTGGRIGWRWRLTAAAGAAADCSLITVHAGRARLATGCELTAERDSVIRIDEWETALAGGELAVACHHKHLVLAEGANVAWRCALAGGGCQRHLSEAELTGARAEVHLGGSSVVGGGHQSHHLVRVRHRVGDAVSRQVFKTVARERGSASFDGLIHVDHGADGTDAFQQANGLELGERARISARPQLDVYTDDVVASHGATVGQPDPEEVRYLRSRGLDEREATALIVDGFVTEGLVGMADEELHARALGELLAGLRT